MSETDGRSTEECCHNSQTMDFASLRNFLEGAAATRRQDESDEGCDTTYNASFDEEIQQATVKNPSSPSSDRDESTSPICPIWNEKLDDHIVANSSVQVNSESFTDKGVSFASVTDTNFSVIGLANKTSSKLSNAPSTTSDVELNPVDSALWKRQHSEEMKELDKIVARAIPPSDKPVHKHRSGISPKKARMFESKSSTVSLSTTTTDSSSLAKKDPAPPQVDHIRLFGHGRRWTLLALLFSWISCCTAVFSRMSTEFVDLKHPLIVAPLYQPVHSVGMIRMEICYNETVARTPGCKVIRLSPEEVDDWVFNLSRSLLTMAAGLGVALTFVLSTAVFWESINLRFLGFGFLLTYFFQSFALLFFDTDLCNDFKCSMGSGSILCVVTSVLWIGTCISVAKMDSFKIKATRRRRRAARRKARQEKREQMAQKLRKEAAERSESSGTMETEEDLDETAHDLEEGVLPDVDDTEIQV